VLGGIAPSPSHGQLPSTLSVALQAFCPRCQALTRRAPPSPCPPFAADADLYPYLLVNIGSGVSIIKVRSPSLKTPRRPCRAALASLPSARALATTGAAHPTHTHTLCAPPLCPGQVDGDGQFTRISGSSVGGGTFWGLTSLLTGKQDFDEILALSATGNNANVSSARRGGAVLHGCCMGAA
jgi:hypothetical protein